MTATLSMTFEHRKKGRMQAWTNAQQQLQQKGNGSSILDRTGDNEAR